MRVHLLRKKKEITFGGRLWQRERPLLAHDKGIWIAEGQVKTYQSESFLLSGLPMVEISLWRRLFGPGQKGRGQKVRAKMSVNPLNLRSLIFLLSKFGIEFLAVAETT